MFSAVVQVRALFRTTFTKLNVHKVHTHMHIPDTISVFVCFVCFDKGCVKNVKPIHMKEIRLSRVVKIGTHLHTCLL